MSAKEIDLERLKDPFPASEIEWRVSRAGVKSNGEVWAKILAYVTNRAIMDRLDAVCGPENWRDELVTWQGNSAVLCGLSIRINGEWVTKWDVAENTDFEPVKGGASGAEKRAGVKWGIGRYLYRLEETWASVHDKGTFAGQYTDKSGAKHFFKYDPPELPAWALPAVEKKQTEKSEIWGEQISSAANADALRAVWKKMPVDQREAWEDDVKEKRKVFGI